MYFVQISRLERGFLLSAIRTRVPGGRRRRRLPLGGLIIDTLLKGYN